MIPAIGRNVILLGLYSNGADRAPAVITRNWGGDRDTKDGPVLVNLTAFPDAAPPCFFGSVHLFEDEHQAMAHMAGNQGATAAYWPARV